MNRLEKLVLLGMLLQGFLIFLYAVFDYGFLFKTRGDLGNLARGVVFGAFQLLFWHMYKSDAGKEVELDAKLNELLRTMNQHQQLTNQEQNGNARPR